MTESNDSRWRTDPDLVGQYHRTDGVTELGHKHDRYMARVDAATVTLDDDLSIEPAGDGGFRMTVPWTTGTWLAGRGSCIRREGHPDIDLYSLLRHAYETGRRGVLDVADFPLVEKRSPFFKPTARPL